MQSDLPAYANGQRYLSKNGPERERFSDPDASWGHRSAVSTRKGGGFYGYKLHAAVCSRTGLPLAWEVKTARSHESTAVPGLLDALRVRGFAPETAALDKGYDVRPVYETCEAIGCSPVIPLRETPDVKRGDHLAPTLEVAPALRLAGDERVQPGRLPPQGARPTLAARTAPLRSLALEVGSGERPDAVLAGRGRAAVEREFGRLKHEYGLAPLRVRGLERVALHADLVMLARLSQALARARAVPLAA